MRVACLAKCVLAGSVLTTMSAFAAEIDARPPDKLTASGYYARQIDVANGGGGALSYLHYFTPDFIGGGGYEHQYISDADIDIGSLNVVWGHGQTGSRSTVYGEARIGEGDDGAGSKYDYQVVALGMNQQFTTQFSVDLESRQYDIDQTHGNLPKIGFNYFWTPRVLTYVSYANSVGGNLGSELTTARIEYLSPAINLKLGGARGKASPNVLVIVPGEAEATAAPATRSRQGFLGIGKTFGSGEVLLVGDYLKTGDDSKRVTVTLSYTAFLGSRGPR